MLIQLEFVNELFNYFNCYFSNENNRCSHMVQALYLIETLTSLTYLFDPRHRL